MIVIFSAVIASVGAVLFAHKIASPQNVKTVRTPMNKVDLVKEFSSLAKILLAELDRIQVASKKNPADLDLAVKSLETIIKRAWALDSFYGERDVVTFLNVLKTSLALEREDVSNEYLRTLKDVVTQFVPLCSEAIIRGDQNEINTFSNSCMQVLKGFTRRLENTNRQKINSFH